MKPFYITTPIYYVNAQPHIGHVYSTLIGDVLKRYKKLSNNDVYLLTGTDEHGLKVDQSAQKANMTPKEFTDNISNIFRTYFNELQFDYDRFIRTTDEDHIDEVKKMWNVMYDKGDIYLGEYEGWYSISDETFVPENMIEDRIDIKTGELYKVYKETNNRVEKLVEKNYMFKLSKYKQQILEYIRQPDFIVPKFKQEEVIRTLESDLPDLSVSRKKTITTWGITVPNDPDHIIYVWLDALANYKTGGDGFGSDVFPADIHIIGKDILKFHAIYWIGFLLSCGLPLPKKILSHGWWLSDGVKMSKSLNNVVDPRKMITTYGLDEFRYFLLRESSFESDGNFTEGSIRTRIIELANTIGNLACRCLCTKLNPTDNIPNSYELVDILDIELVDKLNKMICDSDKYMKIPDIQTYIITIYNYSQEVNKYITSMEPWKLIKINTERFNQVKYNMLESLRIISILLSPILVEKTKIILGHLQINIIDKSMLRYGFFSEKNKINRDIEILFNKN